MTCGHSLVVERLDLQNTKDRAKDTGKDIAQ